MAAMAGSDAMEKRITELEVKMAFTEDMVEELNRTVFRQQQHIEQLQQEIRELRRQAQTSLPAAGNPSDEVPPHY
jgi:SlyX protein